MRHSVALVTLGFLVLLLQLQSSLGSPEEELSLFFNPREDPLSQAPLESMSERVRAKLSFRKYIDKMQAVENCEERRFLAVAPQYAGLGSWFNAIITSISEGKRNKPATSR